MVVYPDFLLTANGQDVTDYIKANLVSLSLDDRDGETGDSDELTITVTGIYERPLLGDTLKLALGVRGSLYNYGVFKVQTTAIDHKSGITEIRATAIDFSGSLKERKSQLWEALTLADIAKQIAARHGLAAITSEAHKPDSGAETIAIASQAQHDTSDLAFLQRLAQVHGFLCFIKDNTIILQQKGSAASYVHEITLDKSDCTALNIERAAKDNYKSVKLEWHDKDSASTQSVLAGAGDPVYVMRGAQPKNPQEAQAMASAKLVKLNQGAVSGSLSFIGGRLIHAGGKLTLTGIGGDSGSYHMEGATHSITASEYTINVEFRELKEL